MTQHKQVDSETNQFNKKQNMVRFGVIASIATAASAVEWMGSLRPLEPVQFRKARSGSISSLGPLEPRRQKKDIFRSSYSLGPLEPRKQRKARMGTLSSIGGIEYGVRDVKGFAGAANGSIDLSKGIRDLGEAPNLKELRGGYGGYNARVGPILNRYKGRKVYGRGAKYDRLNGAVDRASVAVSGYDMVGGYGSRKVVTREYYTDRGSIEAADAGHAASVDTKHYAGKRQYGGYGKQSYGGKAGYQGVGYGKIGYGKGGYGGRGYGGRGYGGLGYGGRKSYGGGKAYADQGGYGYEGGKTKKAGYAYANYYREGQPYRNKW